MNAKVLLEDVNSLKNVAFSTRSNPFPFRVELSVAHEADALHLVTYFSTSVRSIFIVFI